MVSRFFDQGSKAFFLAHRVDSYFNLFHMFASSITMVANALALLSSTFRTRC